MQAAQKEFLEERFAAKEWRGRSASGRRLLKGFRFEGSELKGWKLLRVNDSDEGKTKILRSMWSRGDDVEELLAVEVFVSTSVKDAHETLLEALANMQSGAIERKN